MKKINTFIIIQLIILTFIFSCKKPGSGITSGGNNTVPANKDINYINENCNCDCINHGFYCKEGFPTLEASLGIIIPNVDLRKVPDNRKASETDRNYVKYYYPELTEEELENITLYEIDTLLDKLPLKTFGTEYVKLIERRINYQYDEGIDFFADLSEWTVAQDDDYIAWENSKPLMTYKYRERGITDVDAKYLAKTYHTDESILAQSDEVLKKHLEEYYEIKLDYARFITNPDTYTPSSPLFSD